MTHSTAALPPTESRRRLFAASGLAALLTLALASGCATLGVANYTVISVEEEWELGRELEREIAEQVELSRDAVVNRYVDRMGQEIVANTDKAELPWRFHVIEEGSVNAFNAPGGLVYIHTGLIAAAENASELAAVVAHEIGHGVARHGAQQLTRQYEMALLANVILGQDPAVAAEIAAAIVAGGAQARFSREHEHEADEMGVRFMAEAGYDPQGMVSFFAKLEELRERQPGTVERFFATHPSVPDRVERVEAQIDRLNLAQQFTARNGEFEEVRRRAR